MMAADTTNLPNQQQQQVSVTPSILSLRFPFDLKKDQLDAADAWVQNGCRGSVIYSTGTGKTEIAWECARRAADGKKKFRVLFLVPRIVLIEQNVQRLKRYGIPEISIGAYYGQRKDADKEIAISTYQSVIHNFDLVRRADMVVMDEVHLVGATAVEFTKVFDVIAEDPSKALLGLTATIDTGDAKYERVLNAAPVVKRYSISDAVADRRLARPTIEEVPVELDDQDRAAYESYSKTIRDISDQLRTSDPAQIKDILWSRSPPHKKQLAREWFAAVRERKMLLSATREKLYAAADLIVERHSEERVMVFSETIESIQRLKALLEAKGVPAEIIHASVPDKERQRILASWGTDFFPLLSVHTLEIGYDVPQVAVAVILATSNNQNRIAQRIGRVVRKVEGKERALIYVVYAEGTRDDAMLDAVYRAIGSSNGRGGGARKSQ